MIDDAPQGKPNFHDPTTERRRGALIVSIASISALAGISAFHAIGFGPMMFCLLTILGAAGVASLRDVPREPEHLPSEEWDAEAGDQVAPSVQPLVLLGAVIDAVPDAALAIDAEGKIEAANSLARQVFGLPEQGGRVSHYLRRPEVLDAISEAALNGGAPAEVVFQTTGTPERDLRAHISPLALSDRTLALVVFHDQTAARKLEEMRVDFLATASHELRTPLAAVISAAETLGGPARGDAAASDRFLNIMNVQADRMRRLIDDLLSLSKIELNEHVPPGDLIDLEPIVAEAVDQLGHLAEKRQVSLACSGLGAPASVIGSRDELAQVVLNLIDNAIKYSAPGSTVSITLDAAQPREKAIAGLHTFTEGARISILPPPLGGVRPFVGLQVIDAGPGIPRSALPRLSERFYRVEERRNSERMGTGLGLAIVKHIVNRHRGGLFVASQVGVGSAFAILLPGSDPVT